MRLNLICGIINFYALCRFPRKSIIYRDNPFRAFYSKYIGELNFNGIELGLSHLPSEIKKAVNDSDNPINFGLFGHIHRLQMVRRYGLNVGIDCNHFYPFSIDDVKFQINGIKNHYDEEVFDH